MKVFKIFSFLLFSIVLLSFYSCSDDSNSVVIDSKLVFPEQDEESRLLFDDMSHFQDFMKTFENVTLDELSALGDENDFISAYSLRTLKEQEQGHRIIDEVIEDEKFSSIINFKNEIAFKDGMIYQANHDYCFWVNKEFYNLIHDFRNEDLSSIGFNSNGETTYKNELVVLRTIQESSNPVQDGASNRGSAETEFNTDPRSKLQGCTHRRNYLIYQNIFAESEGEIRNGPFWNRWRGLDLQNVSVSSNNATLLFGSQRIPVLVPFNVNLFNSQSASFRLYWAVGIGVTGTIGGSFDPAPLGGFPEVQRGSSATHSGTNQGQVITFNTQW